MTTCDTCHGSGRITSSSGSHLDVEYERSCESCDGRGHIASARVQCKACPWKKSTVPERDIPGGYCETKHRRLAITIAEPGSLTGLVSRSPMMMMGCHEFPARREQPCVGWVIHQLNDGNNIALRMAARDGRFKNYRIIGPQHTCLEDTLPKKKRRKRA